MALDEALTNELRAWVSQKFQDSELNASDLSEYILQFFSSNKPREEIFTELQKELQELVGPAGPAAVTELFAVIDQYNNASQGASASQATASGAAAQFVPAAAQPANQGGVQPQQAQQVQQSSTIEQPSFSGFGNGFPPANNAEPGVGIQAPQATNEQQIPAQQPAENPFAAPNTLKGGQQEFRQNFRSDFNPSNPGFQPPAFPQQPPRNNKPKNGFLPGFGFQGFSSTGGSSEGASQAPAMPMPPNGMPEMMMPNGMPFVPVPVPMQKPYSKYPQNRQNFQQRGSKYSRYSSIHNEISIANRKLVVENIPEDKLSDEEIKNFFGKFGNVTSIKTSPAEKLSIIEFETHDQAETAHKSPEPIFGNRFVKIYWKKHSARDAEEEQTPDLNIEDIRRIQAIKQQQFEEREAKRKELNAKIKSVIAQQTELLQEREKQLLSGGGTPEEHVQAQKISENLSNELISLKNELTALTAGSNTGQPFRGRGAFRGRARGYNPYQRGFAPRGRGGMIARLSGATLDRRPKAIMLQGVPESADETLRSRLVANNFTDYSRKDDSTVVVDFMDRKSAEMFFNSTGRIQELQGVHKEWTNSVDQSTDAME